MMRIAILVIAAVLCVVASVAIGAFWRAGDGEGSSAPGKSFTVGPGSGSQRLEADGKPNRQGLHAVCVRQPDGPPTITLSALDPQGRTGKVACSTCHSVRPANLENRTAATLDEYHQGLKFNHGSLACYSCHDPKNADGLRLADGTTVAYSDVMTLCSQCHSPQATSFAHGAHGGMNGYWDLSRGPQTKNNCIDCHDPHTPSYPKMIVDFKPRDRFLHEEEAPHDNHE